MSVAVRVGISMCVIISVRTSINTGAAIPSYSIIISTGISLSIGSSFSTSISTGIGVNIGAIVSSSISISISTSTRIRPAFALILHS